MNILWMSFLSVTLLTPCFAARAKRAPQKDPAGFLMAKDISPSRISSNIKLKNDRDSATVVHGIYVSQFSYVNPGQSCSSATVMYSATGKIAGGPFVMPVRIPAHGSAPVGANYLYNMLYAANYYIQITFPSTPPGCALPGCTWGSDSTVYQWCIYLGAIAPVSATAGYTSNVVPALNTISAGGYNYELVTDYKYIGPISCNDKTLTCSVTTPQSQAF